MRRFARGHVFSVVVCVWAVCMQLALVPSSIVPSSFFSMSMGQEPNPPSISPATPSSLAKAERASEAGIRVLAIGVSRFDNAPDLRYTNDDAERVVKAYREVGGLQEDQVTLLVDSEEVKVDLRSLENSIAAQFQAANANDTCVLFFSGHGFANSSSFYLVPSDFSIDDAERTGLSLERLRELIASSKAKTKIIILDCCHSGAVGKTPMNTGQVAASFRAIPGCVAIAASRSDELSLETDKLKSGVFTQSLIEALRGRANIRVDAAIDVLELFQYASDRVKTETDGRQSPSISMDQFDRIPTVISLVHPDRPSDLVGVIPFPLPPSEQTMGIVIDTISRFPEADPRRTIGMCHWVVKHASPNSDAARQATKLIAVVDEALLAGRCKLGPKAEEEE